MMLPLKVNHFQELCQSPQVQTSRWTVEEMHTHVQMSMSDSCITQTKIVAFKWIKQLLSSTLAPVQMGCVSIVLQTLLHAAI